MAAYETTSSGTGPFGNVTMCPRDRKEASSESRETIAPTTDEQPPETDAMPFQGAIKFALLQLQLIISRLVSSTDCERLGADRSFDSQ